MAPAPVGQPGSPVMSPPANIRALPTLLQRTQSFPRRKVLVVGDLVADHYIYGQTERVSREAPVLIVRYEAAEVKLGGGANAAANVRSLGAQVIARGVLGEDEMGAARRAGFKAAGMQLDAVTGPGVRTESKTRILAGGVNTTRQQMLRLDRSGGALSPKLQKQLARRLAQSAQGVDAVLVSDYGSGVLGDEVREALQKLAGAGLPVCVDSRYQLRSFLGMTLAKPNEPELESLTGMPVASDDQLVAAGRCALKLLRCRSLLVTRGHNGMAVFDGRGQVELLPVYGAAEAVDVTGAGDTVIAACTLGLAAGASVLDAARLANIAGALVVQKQGTATVSRLELQDELGPGK